MVKRVITNLLLFKIIIADIIISVIVAGALTWLGIFTYDLASKAAANSSQIKVANIAQYTACINSNKRAAADSARWDTVLKLIDTMPSNANLQKFVIGVEAANKIADKPQKCVKPKDDP